MHTDPDSIDHPRRHWLRGAVALGALMGLGARGQSTLPQAQAQALASRLQMGGCALLIRHTRTEPGIGDPPGFQLGQCQTQRQLSEAGREDARRIGQWFESQRLAPGEVLSSQWCRCKDTAQQAFGRHTEWVALNSTFNDSSRQPAQTQVVRERLAQIAMGRFEVWVTHQVNMTHLCGEYPAMGEAFLVDRGGKLQMRMLLA